MALALPRTPTSTYVARRRALLARLSGGRALLAAGQPRPRNFADNLYPFRAASHFLYFVGEPIVGAALLFAGGRCTLFASPPDADDALWHGQTPDLDELASRHGFDAARPIDELDAALAASGGPAGVGTLPTQDAPSSAWLAARLARPIVPNGGAELAEPSDAALAEAMIGLRLRHDVGAVAELRAAVEASAEAHLAGMRATRPGGAEVEVVAAMTAALCARGLAMSYNPIVTVHGEVLHQQRHDGALAAGDLLLADVGGEVPAGWAADITRVWPVSGVFSPTQRAVYEVVLAAQRAAIARVRAGTRYREVHRTAARVIVEGLRDLGIFRGAVDGLLERGAAAIFFPHGVGHLLGLDVHDMEDLGDRAGYAPGRQRDTRFGDRFLRLDRDLEPGMLVTVEPGFYQIPALLADARVTAGVGADLDRTVLARFADVRGIRIEDDVLVTEGDPDVLSRGAPKDPGEVEAAMRG